MKAMIIIDIPDEIENDDVWLNMVGANDIKADVSLYTEESRRPIKPRLYKDVKVKPIPTYRSGGVWSDGWNACIDQIIGKGDYE